MKINELGPKQYRPEIQKPTEQPKSGLKPKAGKEKSIDKVDVSGISKQSEKTNRLFRIAKAKIQNVPDVRYDKIQAAKEKIENGMYNRPEVMSVLAEKLAKNPEISAALAQSQKNDGSEGMSPQRLELIRNRLNSGFYNKPDVVEKIADSVMKDLGSHGENNS